MTPLLIAVGLFTVLVTASIFYVRKRNARARFIDEYKFPPGIAKRVRKTYPQLSDAQIELVFSALREYFHLCRKAGRRLLAMPSQAVDVAWHEFILFTRNYDLFCRRGLGRFLHHTPAEAMRSPTEASEGIKRTWRLACKRAGINPLAPATMPLLFALDEQLKIGDGFRYHLDCMRAGMVGAGYCASHIGCGAGCGGGCSGKGCSSDSGGSDGGGGDGCGGGGGD